VTVKVRRWLNTNMSQPTTVSHANMTRLRTSDHQDTPFVPGLLYRGVPQRISRSAVRIDAASTLRGSHLQRSPGHRRGAGSAGGAGESSTGLYFG
jgi:hypothetical protein